MAERDSKGLPRPAVSSEFRSAQGRSLSELQTKLYRAGEGYSYTARTVLHYQGPADAGLHRWPALTLTPEQSKKLGITSAELQDRYVASREKAEPGFWQRYQLGLEPRTYSITQSGRATYPQRLSASSRNSSALALADAAATATEQNLVFGFSIDLPFLDEEWSFDLLDVETLSFSFVAHWGFGIRLPVNAELHSPEPMAEGSTYSAGSTVHGINYSGTEYSAVGLPVEGGNEVYFRWVTRGCLEFSGVIDSGEQCAGPNTTRHKDFITPFGPGDDVPFPQIDLAILDYGVAGIDLDVNTRVGSNLITADWLVLGAAQGHGSLSYHGPTLSEALSSIKAIDGPGQALFTADGWLYHFTEFEVSPSLELWVDVEIPIPLAPDIDWEDSWRFRLGTYDLSDFVDRDFLGSDGASVGVHQPGTGYTGPSRLDLSVAVVNVAPTAAIALTGGHETNINGVPTIVGNTGESFSFTGTSHDPGRDGLTLSWDWGDGPPAPDQTAVYPLAGATGPNDATDVRLHAFDRACLYEVTLRSVDDDAAVGEDHASILVTETGKAARLEGFWQHQLSRNGGGLLEAPVIECYLAIVGRVSSLFSEIRPASTMAAALAVINLRQNSGSELEKLDREILMAWLNFAAGAFGYAQLVDTNKDGTMDTPLYQVMQTAESVRLNPSSTAKALREQTQIIHMISVQYSGNSPA